MSDHNDTLQRFMFENAAVRGEVVHLDHAWQQVLERHDYPPVVRELLGEALTAGMLLSATIKIEGTLTIQIQGDGPVNLLVVEITISKQGESIRRSMRGVAEAKEAPEPGNLAALFGQGKIVITIQPEKGDERFQGIVGLEGERIADALQAYLRQSEQLQTQMWLHADEGRTAGLMLQRMPGDSEEDAESWNRINHLASTITDAELLELPPRTLLHRLFHEEDVRLFDAETVQFYCSCSRERVANMLRTLGRAELEDILEEQGKVEVACEFCKQGYSFDVVDVEQLLVTDTQLQPPKTRQ
jgi:molecular chaperone Hsp33